MLTPAGEEEMSVVVFQMLPWDAHNHVFTFCWSGLFPVEEEAGSPLVGVEGWGSGHLELREDLKGPNRTLLRKCQG